MKPDKTVNVKLNLLKGLGCMAIVIAHFTSYMWPEPIGPIIPKAAGFGVPIFLMISGYYAFGKDSDVIKRRLIKIIKIFLFAYYVSPSSLSAISCH